jgi:hypothetical protein
MTRFAINQTVATKVPVVVVDAGLAVGTHRFRLVVSDDSGLVSQPAEVLVQVSRGTVPVARPPGRSAAPTIPLPAQSPKGPR